MENEQTHRHVWEPLILNTDGGPSVDRCKCNAHRIKREGGMTVLNLVPEGQASQLADIAAKQRYELERLQTVDISVSLSAARENPEALLIRTEVPPVNGRNYWLIRINPD